MSAAMGAPGAGPGTALVYDGGAIPRARRLTRELTELGWQLMTTGEPDRVRWWASVRHFPLAVILAGSQAEACRTIDAARACGAPVLVVLPEAGGAVHGELLDAGADLVMADHTDVDLFLAVVRAVLRRARPLDPTERYLQAEGLTVDVRQRQVVAGGRLIGLTSTEFALLRLLMSRATTAVSHVEIMRTVWDGKYVDERNSLRVQVNRLRRKLGDKADDPQYIGAVRGLGYSFLKAVSHVADDASMATRQSGQPEQLREALRKLQRLAVGAASRFEASRSLVDAIVGDGLADACAVFEKRDDRLHCLAYAGLSADWGRAVADGVPLSERYMASTTVNSSRVSQYLTLDFIAPAMAESLHLLQPGGLSSQLSVPLFDRLGTWGQMGFGRRADSAFTPDHSTVLEAAAYLLGAIHAPTTVDHLTPATS